MSSTEKAQAKILLELMEARSKVTTGTLRVRIPGGGLSFMAAGGSVQDLHISPSAFDPMIGAAAGPAGYLYCNSIPSGQAAGHGECDPATAPHRVFVAVESDGSECYVAARRVAELSAAAATVPNAA